jgi:hypothetical protein
MRARPGFKRETGNNITRLVLGILTWGKKGKGPTTTRVHLFQIVKPYALTFCFVCFVFLRQGLNIQPRLALKAPSSAGIISVYHYSLLALTFK